MLAVQAAEGYLPAVLPPGAKGSPDDRVLTCLLWYNQLLVSWTYKAC